MAIRVIAGTAKGKRLKMVPGDTTRPIMDRVKEALFSILGNHIYDSNFLDLYAGTGSVGIEALSRGAAHALFTDLDREAVKTIQKNLEIAGLGDHAVIRRVDAFELLKQQSTTKYHYIYVAPPQYKGWWQKTLQAIDENTTWLADDGMVIAQIDPSEQENISFQNLQPFDERRYGNTLLWFFEHHPSMPEE